MYTISMCMYLSVYTYYIIQGDSPRIFTQFFIQIKWCPALLMQNYIYQIRTSLFTINCLVDIYFKNIDGLNSKFKRIISQYLKYIDIELYWKVLTLLK